MTEGKLWKGTGCSAYVLCISIFAGVVYAEENLQPCYHEALLECPRYSICARLNSTNSIELKCICMQPFQHNPKWQAAQNASIANSTSITVIEENYCIHSTSIEPEENKVIVYMRSAANPQHLVFGIILVLLAVTVATSLLYGLKVLRPIKRTKAVYKKLRNRRQNITPLQEMDELELNRRYEMETY